MAFQARWIIGRTITAVNMRWFDDGRGETAPDPVLTLDNGAKIFFSTVETDTGEYGHSINYIKP